MSDGAHPWGVVFNHIRTRHSHPLCPVRLALD